METDTTEISSWEDHQPSIAEYVPVGEYDADRNIWTGHMASRTVPGKRHQLTRTMGGGWRCTCPGFTTHHHCYHVYYAMAWWRRNDVSGRIADYHEQLDEWFQRVLRRQAVNARVVAAVSEELLKRGLTHGLPGKVQ